MHFTQAPRLRIHGENRRWSLHPNDFISFTLHDVNFTNVDPVRDDLYFLDCTKMPRVFLDLMEARTVDLWNGVEWANEQTYASLSNCFTAATRVPCYNSKRLQLPTTPGAFCSLQISIQGVHCDARQVYTPIIIMEEVIMSPAAATAIIRASAVNAGGKIITPYEPLADIVEENEEDEDDDDEDEDYDEDEQPLAKRQRTCSPPDELTDEEWGAFDHEMAAANAQIEEEDVLPLTEWLENVIEAVRTPPLPASASVWRNVDMDATPPF